ncbi:MAG: hypothetical protein HY816_09295 [Candidatus Wallbacteria bacterium]|nr:hypothetical protein [Candidatus Wallbacteria bacterium]
MRFFQIYQYLAPAVMFPLAYWLFLRRYNGNHPMTLFALSVPITFSYVVPALGMNWLRIWAMRTRFRIVRIRPHHGFLFGSAASLFALLCLPPLAAPAGLAEAMRAGFVLGTVIGFWNWLYDIHAIRVGFLQVYNRPFAEGRGPEAIAGDYAPVFFGTFGFAYGIALRVAESDLLLLGHSDHFWPLLAVSTGLVLAAPGLAYVAQSYVLRGESGLRSYAPEDSSC